MLPYDADRNVKGLNYVNSKYLAKLSASTSSKLMLEFQCFINHIFG